MREGEFEDFVARHENRVYRTALAVTGSAADAEDITQETFIKALAGAPRFESAEHEAAWLVRVAVNKSRDFLRALRRRRTEPLSDALGASDAQPSELVEQIFALPPKYRAVIHLFYYEGYSTKEIAAITKQREPTVRSALSRARAKLAKLLKEEDWL